MAINNGETALYEGNVDAKNMEMEERTLVLGCREKQVGGAGGATLVWLASCAFLASANVNLNLVELNLACSNLQHDLAYHNTCTLLIYENFMSCWSLWDAATANGLHNFTL